MLLSYTIVDFYLLYDGAVDIQIWALLTRSWWKVSDTRVTGKPCGPLVGWEIPILSNQGSCHIKGVKCKYMQHTGYWQLIKSQVTKIIFLPFLVFKVGFKFREFFVMYMHALVDNFNLYISVHCWFISLSFLHRRTNLTRSLFHSAPVTSQDCDADSQGVASCSINWFSLHKDSYNSIERPTLPVLCSVGEDSQALLPLLNPPQVSAHSHSLTKLQYKHGLSRQRFW